MTKKQVGLLTAFLLLVAAFLGCAKSYFDLEIARYQAQARELQAIAAAAAQSKLNSNGTDVITVVNVQTNGPNMVLEAGYELNQGLQQPIGESEFTVQDYPPGHYLLEEAKNAQAVVSSVAQSVNDFLAEHPDGRVSKVEIIGCADGMRVIPGVLYKGDLGTFRDFQYFSYDRNQFDRMNLLPGVTKLSNESIAFLRAYGALVSVADSDRDRKLQTGYQQISTATTTERGGAYRKVIIRVSFDRILEREYSELSRPAKFILDRKQRPTG